MLVWFAASAFGAGPDIGVLLWSDTIPGQVAMRQGLEAEAARLRAGGAEFELHIEVAGDGPEGMERQIRQMEQMVASGMDALIVQPTDGAALTAPLQKANAANIPVVAFDQYVKGGELTSYITSDNRQAGWMGGAYIAARFPDDAPIRLAIVEYPHVSSTIERVDGFMDALDKLGQPVEVVGTYLGVDPSSGALAAKKLLAQHPEKGSIDVVFTVNDGGGLSVVDALAAAGRQEIVVATNDGDPASITNIRNGRLTVIDSAQFCGQLGVLSMRTTWQVLKGEKVSEHLLVPTFPVTAETVERYNGWLGDLPTAFELPWNGVRWTPDVRRVGAQQP